MKTCTECGARYEGAETRCAADGAPLADEAGGAPGGAAGGQDGGDPLLGTTVDGRFAIRRALGRGAMGTVYLATQLSVGRDVAIKVLRPHLVTNEESVRRFLVEARAATRLSSPHTVTVHDFGRTADGTPYLAMELVDGRGLEAVLEAEAPLSERRVCHIAAQMCEALAEAHDKGIVHRDLKPENVALCRVGDRADFVKVLDFGIARFLEADDTHRVTATGVVVGTPAYMSPEQARGEELDGRSDIYSLGVMLFELLSGRLPFTGRRAVDMLLARLQHDPPSLMETVRHAASAGGRRTPQPGVSPGMDDLVRRMMSREREDRPSSVRELLAELELLGQSSGASLAPPVAAAPVVVITPEARAPAPTELNGPGARSATETAVAIALAETGATPSGAGPTPGEDEADDALPTPRRWPWLAAALVLLAVAAVALSLPGGADSTGAAAGSEQRSAALDAPRGADRSPDGPLPAAAAEDAATVSGAAPDGRISAEPPADTRESVGVAPSDGAASPGPSGPQDTAPGSAPGSAVAGSPAAVLVKVATVPPGATVTELTPDAALWRGTTPLDLTRPARTPVRLRLTLEGHADVTVEVPFDAPHELRIPLQRTTARPRPGRVSAQAEPPKPLVNDPGELK